MTKNEKVKGGGVDLSYPVYIISKDMKHITVGTTNPAKINQVRGALSRLPVTVDGIPPGIQVPEVEEDGHTSTENARLKAVAYSGIIPGLVLSMDNFLHIDGLDEANQPGLNVRRIPGWTKRPSDDEILVYYHNVLESLGGKTTGYWDFAVCVAHAGQVLGETTIRSPRQFVIPASTQVIPGFPLDSFQVNPATGHYLSEMDEAERETFRRNGFGGALHQFMQSLLTEP